MGERKRKNFIVDFHYGHMDFVNFLFSGGFALLVVLLGWSSQITSKSKEIRQMEKRFSEKIGKKYKKDYNKIINKAGTFDESLSSLVGFLYSKTDDQDIETLNRIRVVKKAIPELNKKYNFRFWMMFISSLSFLISGIVYLLFAEFRGYVIVVNTIFVSIMFFNLIAAHILEKKYVEEMAELMEEDL